MLDEGWEVACMAQADKSWDERLREAGERLEEELQRAVRFLDEEVVPEVRRGSSSVLRTASERLRTVADHLDDERKRREGGA